MSVIRSYVNGFELTDLTENLMIIPNVWGLSQQLGIFSTEGVVNETVTVEVITKSYGLLEDRVRGQRAMLNGNDGRTLKSFAVPHFNGDDYITPRDLVGKRAYGTQGPETLDLVRARKLERIRATHAATLEGARMHTIVNGTAYAPQGTVSYDWYSEFGVTRKEVDFVLDVGTTDLIAKIEEVIAHIQDNAFTGSIQGDIFALCSPEFFSALIAHPTMKEAYKYYASAPQILRDRLQASGFDARYREFYFGGVLFIEYRGGFAGVTGAPVTRYIPAGDAYFMPRSTGEEFKTYFGPAEKFDLVGTIGQEAYAFEYADPKGEKITIETETNFLNVLRRPQLIVRGYA
ncbi:hypothetical protein D3C85_607410 [compost metagenome]